MTFQAGSNRHVRGMKAEDLFFEIMQRRGCRITRSTKYEDKFEHTDFHVDGKRYDVKSVKRVNGVFTDKQIWVEIHGISAPGWLYSKHVTHFAFKKLDNTFMSISKNDLQKVIADHYCNLKVTSEISKISAEPQKYCYSRAANHGLPAQPKERVVLVDSNHVQKYVTILK